MWFGSDGQHYQQRIFDLLLNMIVFCCKLYSYKRNTFASIKFGKCKPCLRPCSASMILSFLLTLLPLNWLWLPFHPYVWSRETNIEACKIYSPSSSYTHSPCFPKKKIYTQSCCWFFSYRIFGFSLNAKHKTLIPLKNDHALDGKEERKIQNCQLWSVPCTCQSWPCITVWYTHIYKRTQSINLEHNRSLHHKFVSFTFL